MTYAISACLTCTSYHGFLCLFCMEPEPIWDKIAIALFIVYDEKYHNFLINQNIWYLRLWIKILRTMCTFVLIPLLGGFCSGNFLLYEFYRIYLSVETVMIQMILAYHITVVAQCFDAEYKCTIFPPSLEFHWEFHAICWQK